MCPSSPSRPSRARGLKLRMGLSALMAWSSRPSRARGLKLRRQQQEREDAAVAPFTGAWIETIALVCARAGQAVAPFTGAWIETNRHPTHTPTPRRSRPSRARGLKRCVDGGIRLVRRVAPFTGAWIETPALWHRRPHGAVAPFTGAWIETCQQQPQRHHASSSRPSRARGLKPDVDRGAGYQRGRRALHGRVD